MKLYICDHSGQNSEQRAIKCKSTSCMHYDIHKECDAHELFCISVQSFLVKCREATAEEMLDI